MKSRLNFVHFLLLCLLILAVGLIFVYKRGSSKYENLLNNERQQTGILSAKVDSLTSLITKYRGLLEIEKNLNSLQLKRDMKRVV